MEKTNNITFLKSFLFENSLPPIFMQARLNTASFETKHTCLTLERKIFKINDVPDYLEFTLTPFPNKTMVKKVKTLTGHVVELVKFKTIQDYLNYKLSSKNRSNLKRYQKRLESCFNIKYISYYGAIEEKEYDRLFTVLRTLLIRRFNEKQQTNYELQHLDEYHHALRPLIQEKKASLFVIYDGEKPISIRINMFRGRLAYYIISGYDIDYSKFHLGSIDMLKNIEWCIHHKFEAYDLLKSYDYYKTHWATKTHYYYNYLVYSISSTTGHYLFIKEIVTYFIYNFLKKYGILEFYKKIKKNRFGFRRRTENNASFKFSPFDEKPDNDMVEVDLNSEAYAFLRRPIYNFLFLNNAYVHHVRVSKLVNRQNDYLVQTKGTCKLLTVY